MPEIDQEVQTFRRFVDDEFYPPNHPQLRAFGTPGALAVKRCKGLGPPFVKIGRRVFYHGADLNRLLDEGKVEPRAA